MREIGAFEAKNKLGQLLDLVEAGDEVAITRRGKVVARLTPPEDAVNRQAALEAATRICLRRQGVTLDGIDIKELVAEGRR